VHRPLGEQGEDGGTDVAATGAEAASATWPAATAEVGPMAMMASVPGMA